MQYLILSVQRSLFTGVILLIVIMRLLSAQATLEPVEDVYIVTFGGGEGCNVFLKYDIASVPSTAIIDSVALVPFVWQVNPGWDGDVIFWNVNNQTWTESDSARLIWDSPTSDSTHQTSGFGTGPGYTQSADLTDIFLQDFNISNTYCSIKLKDPDDPTTTPMPGSYPFDYDDTLALGERTGGNHMIFYPHEFSNAPPWLIIAFHEIGIIEAKKDDAHLALQIYPNPFQDLTKITFSTVCTKEKNTLRIYDVKGELIKEFNVKPDGQHQQSFVWRTIDNYGNQVSAGIYFCELKTGAHTIIKKICLVK